MRKLALALVFLATVAGFTVAPAVTQQAHAAAWCIMSATNYPKPSVENVSVADGAQNPIRVRDPDVNNGDSFTQNEGTTKAYCPYDVYVPIGKDIRMGCSNGYWEILVAAGWHDTGGGQSWCRYNGTYSNAVAFTVRPNGWWT